MLKYTNCSSYEQLYQKASKLVNKATNLLSQYFLLIHTLCVYF